MKDFFKTLAATLLANLICAVAVGIFFFVILVGGIVALVSSAGTMMKSDIETPVPNGAFLVLDLNTTITDAPERFSGNFRAVFADSPSNTGLWDIVSALDAAASDKRIRGVYIHGSLSSQQYGSGYAALAEVRRAIADFRQASKKPVIAWLDQPTLKNLYVATAASRLLIHPAAEVDMRGLSSTMPYFGPALKKYGIGVQTTKVGKYKSAIEPFLSDKMSDADREQRQRLLESHWKTLVEDIAASREIPSALILEIAGARGLLDAAEARENKLVDGEAHLDEAIAEVVKLGTPDIVNDSFAQIHIRDYVRSQGEKKLGQIATKAKRADMDALGNAIAIVYAEGDIVDGSVSENAIAGDAFAARLRSLRHDPRIKALVLRVNSPGGSAFASEVIQREVRQLTAAGKPVVVSMGHYAASGGYWISASASEIYAERTTITGSIGVFGLMFNIQEAAAALGVHFDGVKTARFADAESITRPRDAQELALLQRRTDKIYDDFINLVAKGRKLPQDKVREIAEGRVWTGADARELGLVDSIGGLREAVAAAARHANLKKGGYTVEQHPETLEPLDVLLELLSQHTEKPVVGAPDGSTGKIGADAVRALAVANPAALASALQTAGASAGVPRSSTSAGSPAFRLLQGASRMATSLEKFNDRTGIYARLPWWDF